MSPGQFLAVEIRIPVPVNLVGNSCSFGTLAKRVYIIRLTVTQDTQSYFGFAEKRESVNKGLESLTGFKFPFVDGRDRAFLRLSVRLHWGIEQGIEHYSRLLFLERGTSGSPSLVKNIF